MDKVFFLLESKNQDFPNVLIWSDNEKIARENAYYTIPASPSGEDTEPVDIGNIKFYERPENASCRELLGEEYTVKTDEHACITISYKGKDYSLDKDKPERLD